MGIVVVMVLLIQDYIVNSKRGAGQFYDKHLFRQFFSGKPEICLPQAGWLATLFAHTLQT